jgi:hypothetical protein
LEIGFIQNSHTEIGSFQVSVGENTSPQVRTEEEGSAKISPLEINFLKTNLFQIDPTQVNSSKVSLPSSITLQQLLTSHNPNLQNTTVPTWTEFLQSTTPFNLKIEIADLPTGQLASGTITGYDTNNRPNSGTLTLDTDGKSLGWFYAASASGFANDTTPENSTLYPLRSHEHQPQTWRFAVATLRERKLPSAFDLAIINALNSGVGSVGWVLVSQFP